MELEKLKDEVLLKIGRNVMLLQQIEHMLKCLVINGKLSGYPSELKTIQEQRKATIHNQTMGQVVRQFLENTFSAPEETRIGPEELKEKWISFRHTIECDDVFYEERKKALASIVAERNDLIHHLLPNNSFESLTQTEQYLDQQREKILPEFEFLKSWLKGILENIDFLTSDEGKNMLMLLFLHQSPLVRCLFEIAEQRARHEGWVVLSNAAHIIRQQIPEEVIDLEKRYGHKKLKGLILETELFDISEEPTDKDGIRVLYRIKPDLNLTD